MKYKLQDIISILPELIIGMTMAVIICLIFTYIILEVIMIIVDRID